MQSEPACVIVETPAPHVLRIILNRPDARNAQNARLLHELDDAISVAIGDDAINVIILAAEGRHFSAGHDLSSTVQGLREDLQSRVPRGTWGSYGGDGAEGWYAVEQEMYLQFTRRLRNLSKPTIAAVQGACIGGGLMLVWACDLIVAADDAYFSDPVVDFGMMGVEWFAHPWELGPRKAKEHLFMAKRWTAQDALQFGMVNEIVPVAQLSDRTLEMATVIAEKPPFAIRLAKEAVNRCTDMGGQAAAIDAVFALHHLNHQHNMLKFGTLMDTSRVKVGK